MLATMLMLLGTTAWADPPAVQAPTEAAAAPDAGPAPEPPVEVTLEAEGEGRRRVLRIVPRRADAWAMQVRRETTMTVRLDDEAPEVSTAPEAFDTLHLAVGDRLEVTIEGAELEGAAAAGVATLNDELASLEGVRLVAALDPRQRHALQVDGLPDEMGQFAAEVLGDVGFALRTTSVPLPEAPVGVGATWTWSRPATEQGVALTERFRATLLAVRGRGATVRVELAAAPDGPVALEGAESVTVSIGATGKVWLDLRRPLARAADLALDGTLTTTWHEGGVAHRGENTFSGRLVVATRPVD